MHLGVDVVIPWQQADLTALGLTKQQCEAKVQWVADDGRVSDGHQALARLLLRSALPWRPLGLLLVVPPVSWLAAWLYDVIAANRGRLPGGTPACALPQDERPQAS